MRWPWATTLLLSAGLCLAVTPPGLEVLLAAHGSLARWQEFGAVEYDKEGWPGTGPATLSDHELVDLATRRVLITSPAYRLGFDGSEIWISPDLKVLGISPRRYVFQPFDFFAMPFLLADANVRAVSLGPRMLQGRSFDTWQVTLSSSTGAAPHEHFVVYITTDTHRLAVIHGIPGDAGSTGLLNGQAVKYTWQETEDLVVPETASFYEWDGEAPGKLLGTARYSNVRFHHDRPSGELFGKPGGAAVDKT